MKNFYFQKILKLTNLRKCSIFEYFIDVTQPNYSDHYLASSTYALPLISSQVITSGTFGSCGGSISGNWAGRRSPKWRKSTGRIRPIRRIWAGPTCGTNASRTSSRPYPNRSDSWSDGPTRRAVGPIWPRLTGRPSCLKCNFINKPYFLHIKFMAYHRKWQDRRARGSSCCIPQAILPIQTLSLAPNSKSTLCSKWRKIRAFGSSCLVYRWMNQLLKRRANSLYFGSYCFATLYRASDFQSNSADLL